MRRSAQHVRKDTVPRGLWAIQRHKRVCLVEAAAVVEHGGRSYAGRRYQHGGPCHQSSGLATARRSPEGPY